LALGLLILQLYLCEWPAAGLSYDLLQGLVKIEECFGVTEFAEVIQSASNDSIQAVRQIEGSGIVFMPRSPPSQGKIMVKPRPDAVVWGFFAIDLMQ